MHIHICTNRELYLPYSLLWCFVGHWKTSHWVSANTVSIYGAFISSNKLDNIHFITVNIFFLCICWNPDAWISQSLEIELSTEGDVLVFHLKLSFVTLVVPTLINNLITKLFSNPTEASVVFLFESKYQNYYLKLLVKIYFCNILNHSNCWYKSVLTL